MIRLPDTYYTQQILDGTASKQGIKQPSPSFSQGADVTFSFYLNYEGNPVDPKKWNLEAVVKKSQYAENVLWLAPYGVGIHSKDTLGNFYFLLPGSITGRFLPGIYHVDIVGTQKVGTGELVKDLVVILLSTAFSIELTASSPNPKLRTMGYTEVSVDADSAINTYKRQSVEPTYPPSVNTTQI